MDIRAWQREQLAYHIAEIIGWDNPEEEYSAIERQNQAGWTMERSLPQFVGQRIPDLNRVMRYEGVVFSPEELRAAYEEGVNILLD